MLPTERLFPVSRCQGRLWASLAVHLLVAGRFGLAASVADALGFEAWVTTGLCLAVRLLASGSGVLCQPFPDAWPASNLPGWYFPLLAAQAEMADAGLLQDGIEGGPLDM